MFLSCANNNNKKINKTGNYFNLLPIGKFLTSNHYLYLDLIKIILIIVRN